MKSFFQITFVTIARDSLARVTFNTSRKNEMADNNVGTGRFLSRKIDQYGRQSVVYTRALGTFIIKPNKVKYNIYASRNNIMKQNGYYGQHPLNNRYFMIIYFCKHINHLLQMSKRIISVIVFSVSMLVPPLQFDPIAVEIRRRCNYPRFVTGEFPRGRTADKSPRRWWKNLGHVAIDLHSFCERNDAPPPRV